jgi:hypothetical protein
MYQVEQFQIQCEILEEVQSGRSKLDEPSAELSDVAALQHKLERLTGCVKRLQRPLGVTMLYGDGGDGFGTQFHFTLSVQAYCTAHNLTYVHRDWRRVGHADNQDQEKWTKSLETFSGAAYEEMRFDDFTGLYTSIVRHKLEVNSDPDRYFSQKFRAVARHKYLLGEPKVNSRSFAATSQSFRVAVHVRRGDIDGDEEQKGRYTSNAATLHMLALVEHEVRDRPKAKEGGVTFHIYSEGQKDKFDDLVAYDPQRVFMHLNEDLKETFHDMVSADALVMAKSSFSYSAALISAGHVFYQSFWHPKLEVWQQLTEEPQEE